MRISEHSSQTTREALPLDLLSSNPGIRPDSTSTMILVNSNSWSMSSERCSSAEVVLCRVSEFRAAQLVSLTLDLSLQMGGQCKGFV